MYNIYICTAYSDEHSYIYAQTALCARFGKSKQTAELGMALSKVFIAFRIQLNTSKRYNKTNATAAEIINAASMRCVEASHQQLINTKTSSAPLLHYCIAFAPNTIVNTSSCLLFILPLLHGTSTSVY